MKFMLSHELKFVQQCHRLIASKKKFYTQNGKTDTQHEAILKHFLQDSMMLYFSAHDVKSLV